MNSPILFLAALGYIVIAVVGLKDGIEGPWFLLIYAIFSFVLIISLRFFIKQGELQSRVSVSFAHDPYRVAVLRSGNKEAIKVAVFSLVDRGLLEESQGLIKRSEKLANVAYRPLDQAIIDACPGWMNVNAIIEGNRLALLTGQYEKELKDQGLLCNAQYSKRRLFLSSLVAGALVLFALLRIFHALSHGRTNIGFLIILCVTAVVCAYRPYSDRHTAHGKATLAHLQALFARLRHHAKKITPGGQNTDAVLLAALFGLHFLPREHFEFLNHLFPHITSSSSGGDGGGGGGGGDSSSGGCSGGCGGGGCGGCG